MAEQTTIYVDRETRHQIKQLADMEGRTTISLVRRLLESYADGTNSLPPFDQAVLFQVGKDEGLDSGIEAVSFIIRDWVRLKKAALDALQAV